MHEDVNGRISADDQKQQRVSETGAQAGQQKQQGGGGEKHLLGDRPLFFKTDLNGRILYVNREFCQLTGFCEEALIGRKFHSILHPDMPEQIIQEMEELLEAGEPWAGVLMHQCDDGALYWARAGATPVMLNGEIVEHLLVLSRPEHEETARADSDYKRMREGKPSRPGLLERINLFKRFTIRQKAVGFALVVAMMIGVYNFFLIDGLYHLGEDWHNYQSSMGERQMLLGEIKTELGYGGAIHNFKNYLLREQNYYRERFLINYDHLKVAFYRYKNLPGNTDEEIQHMLQVESTLDSYRKHIDIVEEMIQQGDRIEAIDSVVKIDDGPALQAFASINAIHKKMMENSKVHFDGEIASRATWLATAAVTLTLLICFVFYLLLSRGLLVPLRKTIGYFRNIAAGNYRERFDFSGRDEVGDVLREIKSMQLTLCFQVNQTRRRGNESLRVKTALDNVTSSVMMVDNDGEIIYLNQAVTWLFSKAEKSIRKELPEFSAAKLPGANLEIFGRPLELERGMLKRITASRTFGVHIGDSSLKLTANPVLNAEGARLGAVLEWIDVTEQLDAEDQVQLLIDKAAEGGLDLRIDTSHYSGFMHNLGEGVNRLLDAVAVPIEETIKVVKALSRGDLNQSMSGEYAGGFAVLQEAINESTRNINSMVTQIRQSSGDIAVFASEIAHGNTRLSERTEEQATALEETACSMEVLTDTVEQNAENARQVNLLAKSARDQAEKGGEVVGRAVEAMQGISGSSRQIADIIGVIDEIAFQTNLLALNAAVEAARAGDQGRGFAVVAGEVRNLAQRCATAAKEIKELIGASVEQVEEGSLLVDESGRSLQEIVTSVKKVSDIVANIAAASQEQSSGIQQVSQMVAQMDKVTARNAVMVEEAATASHSMDNKAKEMRDLVSFFKVADGGSPGASGR